MIIIIVTPSSLVIACQRHYEPYSYREESQGREAGFQNFPTTEVRGGYALPFHVSFINDQHTHKIVVDSENEVDLMVQTRHLQGVIVLVIRGLAQRFNSTSPNSLLKIDN
ncbi:unnamed protein product [Coffea canephora]|uniref:AIR9 PH-like domain-containing protein n=1 Tax=Coffea canephora TaxID=49390 RepID=A0A068UDA2_COFCA|nr:unnamed protein product [Coffea canephora]